MTQKVLKVGTSAAVTIPKDTLAALRLKIGDKVVTTVSEELGVMMIRSAKKKTPIDLEIIAWTKSFLRKYGDALRALAKQ